MKQSIVLFIVTACLTVALCIPQNPKAFQARATVTVDVTTQFNGVVFYSWERKVMRLDFHLDPFDFDIDEREDAALQEGLTVSWIIDGGKQMIWEKTPSRCRYSHYASSFLPLFPTERSRPSLEVVDLKGVPCRVWSEVLNDGRRIKHFVSTFTNNVLLVEVHGHKGKELSIELSAFEVHSEDDILQQALQPLETATCVNVQDIKDDDCFLTCEDNGFCLAGTCYCTFKSVSPPEITVGDCNCEVRPCYDVSCSDQGTCVYTQKPQGSLCSDNNRCTTRDTCDANGNCVGISLDCSSLDDECQVGRCNPLNGLCEAEVLSDGTPCGYLVNGNHTGTCQGGSCRPSDPLGSCGNGRLDSGEICDPGMVETGVHGMCCPSCTPISREVGGCVNDAIKAGYHPDCFVSYCRVKNGNCIAYFMSEGYTCGEGGTCDGAGNCVEQ